MPRVKLQDRQRRPQAASRLVEELAHYLASEEVVGQPLIYEYEFLTGALRVLVFWDEWRSLSNDQLRPEECWKVMRELGASEWFDGEPRLYFATGEEAKKAIELLSDQLPTSKEVWVIVEESVMVQDANWVR